MEASTGSIEVIATQRFHSGVVLPTPISAIASKIRPLNRVSPVMGIRLNIRVAGAATALLVQTAAYGAELRQESLTAWNTYVEQAIGRHQESLRVQDGLWADEPTKSRPANAAIPSISPVGVRSPRPIRAGLIHHWRGEVFLPDATINDVLSVLRNYDRYQEVYAPHVIDSTSRGSNGLTDSFSIAMKNASVFAKTAILADFNASYVKIDDRHWASVSQADHVQEVSGHGTPEERRLPEGTGTGLIWRMASLSRFEERDGGVYIEVEALALSRDIPSYLSLVVNPMVRRISRSSVGTSLLQTEQAIRAMRANVAFAKR